MILDELAQHAKERVEQDCLTFGRQGMAELASQVNRTAFAFEHALKQGMATDGVAIISEVKKASPSKGVISPDFPFLDIAKKYEEIGCHCISVLTEPKWFLGSDEIFTQVREQSNLPMIRKDFTVDEFQIHQAKYLGADAVLLICAILETNQIKEYLALCQELGLSALVEAHDQAELDSAQKAGARIIGVNNRNLKDFSVNLDNAATLRKNVGDDVIFVAESGISTPDDGINLVKSGASALLIGEALMRSQTKKQFVQTIFQGAKS